MKRFDRPLLGFLSRDEMQAVLTAPDAQSWVGQRDQTLFTMLYNTGARVSEVLAVRVGDVVLEGSSCAHLHGKRRKRRTVPLWRSTATLIRAWKRRLDDVADAAPMFPNRSGSMMGRTSAPTSAAAKAGGGRARRCPTRSQSSAPGPRTSPQLPATQPRARS